jgi:AcrR family transcriptional regulator
MKMFSEPRSEGKRKPRSERWDELLEVAAGVFYRKGYNGSSLQDIADELGIMKGSLYYYIRSKEDILFVLLARAYEEALSNAVALAGQDGTTLERLQGLIIGHVEYIGAHVTVSAIFLRDLKCLPDARQQEIIGREVTFPGIFRDLLLEGQRDGSIRPTIDAELTATMILGSLNSVFRWIPQSDPKAAHVIGTHFAEIFASGLRA